MRAFHRGVLPFGVLLFHGCAGVSIPTGGSGAGGGAATPASGSVAADVVGYTNQARSSNGLPPLAVSAKLMDAAAIQARQMAETQLVAHTISGAPYPTLQSRFEAVGYVYAAAAENLAWNQPDARSAVNSWMASSGHRANILDASLREIGAAMARSSKGEPYWVEVFATPR